MIAKGGDFTTTNLPIICTVFNKQLLTHYKQSRKKLDKIKRKLKHPLYHSTPSSNTFLYKALAILPRMSHKILKSAIPLIISAFYCTIGLKVPLVNLINICPSQKNISKTVAEYATLTYLRVLEVLKINTYAYVMVKK